MDCYARYMFPYLETLLVRGVRRERKPLLNSARGRVLDIGSGAGQNFKYLPPQVESCLAVEPSPALARMSHRNSKHASSGNGITVLRAKAEHLPCVSESIDTVVSFLVLCTVQDPQKALWEIHRVLRPGGRLLFFEHVLSKQSTIARWQHKINPIWKRIGCGCNLIRNTAFYMQEVGFRFQQFDRYRSPRMGLAITSQVIRGIAVKFHENPGFPKVPVVSMK